LAKELGVSQPTVWRIEHGLQEPSKSVLKLIELLEVRLKDVSI
jgi:transcriptional regulator with XRE-family HTH domain